MPERLWLSRTAWLSSRTASRGVAVAEALATVSPDRLTRRLQADGSGQRRLESAFRTLFIWEWGSLILDDPGIPKPFATPIESLAWGCSSHERQPVYGCSLVLLLWTNGTLHIPLGLRLWRTGGPSKHEWAVAWLS